MKKLAILLACCASCLVLNSFAGKLGEGITAYYPFNQNRDDRSISGQKWSAGALETDANLSFNTSAGYLGGNGNNPIFGSDNFVLSGAGTGLKVNVVDANAAYPSTSGNWTVSLWAKRESASGDRALPCLYYHGPNYADAAMAVPVEGENGGFGIYLTSGGRVAVGFSTTTDGSSFTYHSITSSAEDNWTDSLANWHHIAVVRDGAIVTLWVDGTSRGSAPIDVAANLSLSSGSRLSLSKSSTAMYLQNGTDDLCFWSRALADNEIAVLSKREGDGLATPLSKLADVEVVEAALTVSEDKLWSAILSDAGITSGNSEYASLAITAQGNPKITFDVADTKLFALSVSGVAVFSMESSLYENGSFEKSLLETTVAISAPDIDFEVNSGWKGSFVRSANAVKLYAQNAETISINIGGGDGTADTSDDAYLVSGNDYYGLYPTPGYAWNNISGQWQSAQRTVTLTSAKAFDGETTTTRNTIQLSGTAKNTYRWTGATVPFLRGYLDDTGSVSVQIVGVPYSVYDVIIYATSDNSQKQLNYFTINRENYTCGSDGIATVGTSAWGVGQTKTAQFGKNAMLVQGITGSTLTISGTRTTNSDGSAKDRVTVCAVQIINKGVVESSDWSANLDATTTFSGGTGAGLSDQSGTWANSSLASIIITNKATDATLTLDGKITAGVLKIVGDAGKNLKLDKASGATLDIAIYDLTDSAEEVPFLFNPDFTKVNPGANRLWCVGYDCVGTPVAGHHYVGSANALTLSTFGSGSVDIGGAGTISGDLGVEGGANVTFSGTYEPSGDVMLSATKGVVDVAQGASVSVSNIRLVDSGTSQSCTLNVDGALTVTSVSSSSNVYNDRNDHKGILFGHWSGNSIVNVGRAGSLTGEAAWMQLAYTAPALMTVDGGYVKVRGVNGSTPGVYGGQRTVSLTLTGGATLEIAEGFVNTQLMTNKYGNATIKTYSYDSSTGWTHPGSIEFTDTTNGTTIDTCGMTNIFSGTLTGAGKIIVSDSVGGGCVSFTGNADNLTGNIVVAANTTLNLGTSRPASTITVADGGVLAVQMQNAGDIIELTTSAQPTNVILYDANGNAFYNPRVNYSDGTLTITPPVPTLEASGTVAFDNAGNWVDSMMPSAGDEVILRLSGDATIAVSGTYTLGTLTITGTGAVTFTGNGTITPARIDVLADATYICNGTVVSCEVPHAIYGTLKTVGDAALTSTGNAIDAAGVLDVESGTLALTCGNCTLKGAIYVRSGATLAPKTEDGFNYGGTLQMHVYGTLSMGATRWTTGGNNTIYLYGGASVTGGGNSQGNIDMNATGAGHIVVKRNETTGDAVVDFSADLRSQNNENGTIEIDPGVTLVMSGKLINQKKITKSGSGALVFDTPEGSTGGYVWVADGAVGGRGFVHNITMDNGTELQPAVGGLSVDGFYVMPAIISIVTNTVEDVTTITTNSEQCVALNFSRVDPDSVSAGDNLTLLSVDGDATLSTGMFDISGARYGTTVSEKKVTATVKAGMPANYLHYDFNGGANNETAKAADSGAKIAPFGEAEGGLSNGRAAKVFYTSASRYTPYWGEYNTPVDASLTGKSPMHAGEMTVTTVAKLNQTNMIIWGLGTASLGNAVIGLVALSPTSAAVVTMNTSGIVDTVVTISNVEDLTNGYHFFAVVANASGTTLYVDSARASSEKVVPREIKQFGQIGSFHNGAQNVDAPGANLVGADGFLLDDWRVYDAALTAKEIKALKRELNPDPLFIRLR